MVIQNILQCLKLTLQFREQIKGTIVQKDNGLALDDFYISFLCIAYKIWQISTGFSKAFKWRGFLSTLIQGILAVRNQPEFYISQESCILSLSGDENSISAKSELFLSVTLMWTFLCK